MLTGLKVSNFKRLETCEIELGDVVVFVGPNNSGKTSALQSLLLWSAGTREWIKQRRSGVPSKRPGITMSRLGLTQIPLRDAKHLWRNLHIDSGRSEEEGGTKIFLNIEVDGEDAGKPWRCGLEFYYANPESFYCRPIRVGASRMAVPEQAGRLDIALLPPLSGMPIEEPELQSGRINVLLGQGRSGEVLRNLCLKVLEASPERWEVVKRSIRGMFRVSLSDPLRDPSRGVVELRYREDGVELDITSAGRGLQQVLLLLAHMHGSPGAVLLLDEPDAHLEVIRQREVFGSLTETARSLGNQLVIASHSEVVLQDATDRDVVVSFVGPPRRVDDRGSQVLKALKQIRAEDYYQAERKGFVLYLEGSTDLAILRSIARLLAHPAAAVLEEPFVVYVANHPKKAEEHFFGLRQAKPNLRCFAIFDNLARPLPNGFDLAHHMWSRREIESYVAFPDILLRYASDVGGDDLVSQAIAASQRDAMQAAITSVEQALRTLRRDAWSPLEKVSDDVLAPIFSQYFERLGLADRIAKSNYHVLVSYLLPNEVPHEVVQVLDAISTALAA